MMGKVIITLKIMPQSPEVDLTGIQEKCEHAVKEFGGEIGKFEEEPIAFGLKALKIVLVIDESLGGTEQLEEQIGEFVGVNSVEVVDCRRAIG